LRQHFWVTTQPMEEPENPAHLLEIVEAIGFDHILLSSDYPHWDFDDRSSWCRRRSATSGAGRFIPATRRRFTVSLEAVQADRRPAAGAEHAGCCE
jgi:predicted TIM-barrel fold metal-dependent hydrolase